MLVARRAHTMCVGTIQDPNADRDWLKRSYVDTSASPFSIDSQTEMMGRLVEGTGDTRMARVGRVSMRVVAVIALASIAVSIVLAVLDLVR